jgi:hypothetical protein
LSVKLYTATTTGPSAGDGTESNSVCNWFLTSAGAELTLRFFLKLHPETNTVSISMAISLIKE